MKQSKTERKGKDRPLARAHTGAWQVLMYISSDFVLFVLCTSYSLTVCITRADKRRLKRVT